jgi:hypothetical protein
VDVALRLARDPVALSSLEQDEAVLRTVDNVLAEALNKDARELIFSDD